MNLKCNSCSKRATHRTQLLQSKSIQQGGGFVGFFGEGAERKKKKVKFKTALYCKDYSCPLLTALSEKLSQDTQCYNVSFLKSRSTQPDCHNEALQRGVALPLEYASKYMPKKTAWGPKYHFQFQCQRDDLETVTTATETQHFSNGVFFAPRFFRVLCLEEKNLVVFSAGTHELCYHCRNQA